MVTLDNVRVARVTPRAILLEIDKSKPGVWVPRSVCENGDELDIGDTDICVQRWFAEREDLPF